MIQGRLNLESLRVGVVQFPGSNCDVDCVDSLNRHYGIKSKYIWHTSSTIGDVDLIVLPGGFSFGDYLRSGALASHSPVMQAVKKFADAGGAILGICNGFQILVETKILPGMLLHNENLQFICKPVFIKNQSSRPLKMPIAHGEGRYFADQTVLNHLEKNSLVAYRYCDENGEVSRESNPNGSLQNIAGVYSENRKVLGMMPHPERACDLLLGGSTDGKEILDDFLKRIAL
jgi:phosphoribosylformylglycinamidine synthase I